MSAVAKIGYVEAQRNASAAAYDALVIQFVDAGYDALEANRIVERYVERAATRLMTENESLFEADHGELVR